MPHPLVDTILRRLETDGLKERRDKAESSYPTSMQVFGTPTPELRAVMSEVAHELRKGPPRLVLSVSVELVGSNTFEGRQAAYELLSMHPEAFALLTVKMVEKLGRGMDNWGSVDAFATLVAGPAWHEGLVTDTAVKRWASSRDPWWRRAALASTVALNVPARGGAGDSRRTLAICRMLYKDDDEMVVKALSWALRSLVPHDKKGVRDFVNRHINTIHPRVIREVGGKIKTGLKTPRRSAVKVKSGAAGRGNKKKPARKTAAKSARKKVKRR